MKADVDNLKRACPMPVLLQRMGLVEFAKKSCRSPFRKDKKPSWGIFQRDGKWFFKDQATGDSGDEITLLARWKELDVKRDFRQLVNLYAELADVPLNGVGQCAAAKSTAKESKPFSWSACVVAFTAAEAEKLAAWRGYSPEFCAWLRAENFIGLYEGNWALPVHGKGGAVISTHYRVEKVGDEKPDWYYFPEGVAVRPLVFGDPNRAANVFVFESPWDAFAVMDLLGWHKPKSVPDTAIVITRGAGNGKRVVGLFRPETTAYAFKQNDETKDGKNAADEWLADVCAYAGCKVLNVATPAQFKDVNDWTRAGATAADIMTGIEDAKPVESLSARAHLNEALSAETKSVQVEAQFLPGPFPIDALNDTQRRIAEAVASVHQLPIELAAIPALATTAAALGKGWKLTGAVNGRENFGNLYFIPGAPKSTGKGAAAQLAEPIIQASARLIDDWKGSEKPILETKRQVLEARAKHLTACLAHRKDRNRSLTDSELATFEAELRDANAELEHIKPMLAAAPSYHVGNATSEALAMKFARNDDTLFALAYEGGDTLRVMLGKYGKGESADFDLWLSGYSVEPYQSDRVLRGNVNITPCLTALIFCQPSLLRELYGNEEAFERGLTARVLPFICESSLQEDDGIERIVSTYHRDAWDDLITGLLDRRVTQLASDAPALVQCGADAREVFRAFHNESIRLRNGQFRDIEGELGRWRENACRIALGLCVADDLAARSLTAAQAERAVKLARWAHYSALQVMNSGRMERRLARVNKLRDLVAEYDSQVTLRILEKSHGFKPDEVERLAADFPSHFCLETKQNPKGGPLSRILTCSRRFA